jgi:hypothetical protein
MPQGYADFQFRLLVCSPVAADSPFESDTLWGRILCALFDGADTEQPLAQSWVDDLQVQAKARDPKWQAPLIVSEGFQCDAKGEPWLPLPLAIGRELQSAERKSAAAVPHPEGASASHEPSRKDLKKVGWVPLSLFRDLCRGKRPDPSELIQLQKRRPRTEPVLRPHLGMNRAAGTSLEGLFYMIALDVYGVPEPPSPSGEAPQPERLALPEITFFLKLRQDVNAGLIESALKRVCDEGWGRAKSRGLGHIRFKSFEPWAEEEATDDQDCFVSLSYFCPSRTDPTEGCWKLEPKHPVPPQFVDGRRVALGAGAERAKSFLRLTAGSCFRLGDHERMQHYGRMLTGLLDPARDGDGNDLPELFHYALAYPWPMRWPLHQPSLNGSDCGKRAMP